MLQATKLPTSLWSKAVLTAAYLWNCTKSVSLPPGTTPFELVNGWKLDHSHLCVFGSCCWVNATNWHSISGYIWFYRGGPMSHVSKHQTIVVSSSIEAEYIAATHVAQKGLWICSLLLELHIPFQSPIPIYLDNLGVTPLSTTACFHQCSKHIDTHYHFIHSHIDNGFFTLFWVPSHKNIVDILTKALDT